MTNQRADEPMQILIGTPAYGDSVTTTYFDTRTGDHHHFFVEGVGEIRDIPTTQNCIGKVGSVPEGYEISRVDLVIRLRKR